MLEQAVGLFYAGLMRLRDAGMYQREYDVMGVLINMLSEDREFLRQKHGDKIDA